MKIVDSRSGRVVQPGQMVPEQPHTDDWYTILRVSFRTLFTRTAHVVRHDGRRDEVVCPVKLLPWITYDVDFPVSIAAILYPS